MTTVQYISFQLPIFPYDFDIFALIAYVVKYEWFRVNFKVASSLNGTIVDFDLILLSIAVIIGFLAILILPYWPYSIIISTLVAIFGEIFITTAIVIHFDAVAIISDSKVHCIFAALFIA